MEHKLAVGLYSEGLRYITKAHEDILSLNILIKDSQAPMAGFGFFCQQSCEKSLKAVLAIKLDATGNAAVEETGKTHSLMHIISIAGKYGYTLPTSVTDDELDELSDYGVKFRYDYVPKGNPLDKKRALEITKEMHNWATDFVQEFKTKNKVS